MNGSEIANQTAAALEDIATGIIQASSLINEIAIASNEQAEGIARVNKGLNQIDQVTQQNTAHAEESAAAAQELSSQAAQLQEMLDRFTLRKKPQRDLPADSPQWKIPQLPLEQEDFYQESDSNPDKEDDSEFGKY